MRLKNFSTISPFRSFSEGKPLIIQQAQIMSKTRPIAHLGKTLLFLLLVSILGPACKSQNVPDPKRPEVVSVPSLTLTSGLLEPGVGIKEIKLGQSRADAEKAFGPPSEEDQNEYSKGQTYLLFHGKGVELRLQDDKIDMITVFAKKEKWTAYPGGTTEGVGVASSAADINKALGTPEEQAPRSLQYLKKGIVFSFDQNREGDGSNARAQHVSIVAPR